VEKDVRLSPGASVELSGYEFTLRGVEGMPGPNYDSDYGTVNVERDGAVATLNPEKRRYRASGQVMTEAAVDARLERDLYVALGEPFDNGDWSLRVYYKPAMRLVWLAGVLMFVGGLLALSDRRYRLAARSTESLPAGIQTT
jgi:cytochrome c-type biogenesis protein CcmF